MKKKYQTKDYHSKIKSWGTAIFDCCVRVCSYLEQNHVPEIIIKWIIYVSRLLILILKLIILLSKLLE